MANEDAGRKSQVSATEDQRPARATGSRKPGVVGRVTEQARETVQGIRLPRPDWRTFAWGLLLLIFVVFIVRNWAPLRINFFGWYVDAPRAVVFAIFFGLGMVTTWLIEIRNRRSGTTAETQEAAERDEEAASSAREAMGTVEPAPEDFADDALFAEESDADVRPEPEAFADEDEPDVASDATPAGEDATAGDALSEEYRFDEPDGDDESDVTQESAENDIDEESSEEDASRKPFWRK